jgi:hypothetical protein
MKMGDTDDGYTLWYEVGKRNLVQQPWYRYMDTTTNSVSNTESRFNPAKLPELNTVNRGSLKRSREEGDLDRTSTTQARPTKRTSLDSTTSPCPPESKSSHMLSLKRQRSADDYDSVSIERAQPAKRVSLGATVSAGSVSPAPMNQCPMILSPGLLKQQERCIHKIKTGCSLSSMACCCACADKRATSSQYMVYVDGKGDVMTGKRWHWYCRGCNSTTSPFPTLILKLTDMQQNSGHERAHAERPLKNL